MRMTALLLSFMLLVMRPDVQPLLQVAACGCCLSWTPFAFCSSLASLLISFSSRSHLRGSAVCDVSPGALVPLPGSTAEASRRC